MCPSNGIFALKNIFGKLKIYKIIVDNIRNKFLKNLFFNLIILALYKTHQVLHLLEHLRKKSFRV